MFSLSHKSFVSTVRFFSSSVRSSERGQGTIEYILILVVSVSIIIGVVSQFNKAFARFVESYMGSYVSCLLETGELPNLGSELESNSACDALYEPFSMASGRPKNERGGSGSSNGRGDEAGKSSRKKKARRISTSGGGGRGSSGVRGGSSSGSNLSSRGDGGGGSGVDSVSAGSEEKEYTGSDGFSSASTSRSGQRKRRRRRISALGGDYFASSGKKEREGKKKKISADTDQEGVGSKPKRVPFSVSQKKQTVAEKEENWSFGYLIRILLIVAMGLAIIIFIGNQVLSIVKGSEK